MGQVTIAPKTPIPPAAAKEGALHQQDLSIKASRASMIEQVKNAPKIPTVWKMVLLEEIAAIDPKHDLLRLDFIRHAHGVGSNFTGTVKEI